MRLGATVSACAGGWRDCVIDPQRRPRQPAPLIGVFAGDGVGAELIDAALLVLRRLETAGGRAVAVEVGGRIGLAAERELGAALPQAALDFCTSIFERGGAILSGPGGGRYVYELRRRLGLFLKLTPIEPRNGLVDASPLRPQRLGNIDMLIVRESLGGAYQGHGEEAADAGGRRIVRHAFTEAEADVRRLLAAAGRLARARSGELAVAIKASGLPALSELWSRCAVAVSAQCGVRCSLLDVDLLAHELLQRPQTFDVVVAPNMCGDILGEVAAVLVGSRVLSCSANYTERGDAVYQTNHGAAYDIAGTDRANPAGQILALAMLLRESLGLEPEARAVEAAIRRVWREGHRTDDLGGDTAHRRGTVELASRIADAAADELTDELAAA